MQIKPAIGFFQAGVLLSAMLHFGGTLSNTSTATELNTVRYTAFCTRRMTTLSLIYCAAATVAKSLNGKFLPLLGEGGQLPHQRPRQP